MPIYEYDCRKCKISFAVLHAAKAAAQSALTAIRRMSRKKISACSSFSPVCGVKKDWKFGWGVSAEVLNRWFRKQD